MARFAIRFASLALLLASGHAAGAATMPLYDAFHTLCAATDAQPDLIAKAIKISPFKITPRTTASTPGPIPISVALWDMEVEGHKMSLAIGRSQEPMGTAMITDTQTCTVTSFGNEDASIGAIRKWAGLPGKGSDLTLYEFQLQGGKRIALEHGDAEIAAKTEGRARHIAIITRSNLGSVMLSRYLPPHPAP
ncbi:MAG TPA: hypothetical protein VGM26_00255 [Rhizomicrobium sp.]|jgi:hypothetical protein